MQKIWAKKPKETNSARYSLPNLGASHQPIRETLTEMFVRVLNKARERDHEETKGMYENRFERGADGGTYYFSRALVALFK